MEKDSTILENALCSGTELTGGKKTYYIEKVLGYGGFGITYKAFSITNDGNIRRKLYYAVKEHFMKGCYRAEDKTSVLYPPTIKNDVAQSRNDFELEAERLMSLSRLSPNIVKVNEKFKSNGTFYYVMEYLDGGDLEKLVKDNKGPLSEAKALSLIVPIAHAVCLLHSGEKRILHLDIKPDNIVMKTDEISGTSYPVLIDFGTAKHFDKKGKPTSLPTAKGATEGYAPIEQYAEISEFDARLDVYALGATLFYLLTGKRPIKAWDITNKYIQDSLPNVSERVRNTIKNAMQKDKTNRIATAESFCREIGNTYTLPLYHELKSLNQKYRIVEVLSENDYSITYKAIISQSVEVIGEMNVRGGNETKANSYYILCECYSKQYDSRLINGCVQPLDDSRKSELLEYFRIEGAKTLGLTNKNLEVFDDEGLIKGEMFQTNGTLYYAIKKKSVRKGLELTWLFSSRTMMFIFVLCVILFGVLYANRGQSSEPGSDVKEDTVVIEDSIAPDSLQPTADELFAKAKTLADYKSLADSGYTKAYYPLAEKYYENKSFAKAVEWAKKSVKANLHVQEANTLLAKVEKAQNDALFAKAKTLADYKSLADKGYTKAYYPLAEKYYADKSYANATEWAKKSVKANLNVQKSKTLISKVEKAQNDALFAKAKTIEEYKALADKGYAKAYAPLAKLYFDKAEDRSDIIYYDKANIYATKALKANVGRDMAVSIVHLLENIGFYDDKSKVKPDV